MKQMALAGWKLRPDAVSRGALPVFRVVALGLTCVVAVLVRLFAVMRYESVIHEFDPYFNFRTTKFLSERGFYEWWNWFDAASWYPLGRVVGQTLYPGLMATAYSMFTVLQKLGFRIDIRDVCVFTAPVFAAFTAIATYFLSQETTGHPGAGLLAALFVVLAPSVMSRSVAGSYDNEAVAIFALIFTFYAYVRALNRGTAASAAFASLAYLYMVASWGGYVFVTNTVAVHMLTVMILGRLTSRHYAVYSVFYVLGTLLCMNIPFVNFQAITSSEHMSSHGVFLFLQAIFLVRLARTYLPTDRFKWLFRGLLWCAPIALGFGFAWLTITGRTRWAGRSMTLLDPTYAQKYIPIISSVSEHQPPNWSSYLFDLHLLSFFAPVGLWILFLAGTDGALFMGVYGLLAVYFSCVMVRLMLVLCPAACVLAGAGLSYILHVAMPRVRDVSALVEAVGSLVNGRRSNAATDEEVKKQSVLRPRLAMKVAAGAVICVGLFTLILSFTKHGVFAAAFAYSNPSIILSYRLRDGSRVIQDDFREAYYWIRENTHPNARLMSWWDYGYQSAAMANRTVIVDNNTWNNSHIATVGLAFSSPEEEAYPILLRLDVDYVFVIFGGYSGYSGDDINKFLWMIRIAGGVYPWIEEPNYYTPRGQYAVDASASPAMRNSLLYRLSYWRFNGDKPQGADHVRRAYIPPVEPLKHLKEVYTTEHWLVRVYKVERPNPFKASVGTIGVADA